MHKVIRKLVTCISLAVNPNKGQLPRISLVFLVAIKTIAAQQVTKGEACRRNFGGETRQVPEHLDAATFHIFEQIGGNAPQVLCQVTIHAFFAGTDQIDPGITGKPIKRQR